MSAPFRIEHLGSVGSTSDILRQRLIAGEKPGLAITATEQTDGRGRLGRQWSSPPGNFYGSILLKPDVDHSRLPSLSLVIALALADAIGPLAQLKWPNDVLINGAKTAGILLEAEDEFVIVGIGVNIVSHPEQTEYPTTDLQSEGLKIGPKQLLNSFLSHLQVYLPKWQRSGFITLRDLWQARGPKLGEVIRLREGHNIQSASFLGLSSNGALIIEQNGIRRTLHSAEIGFPAASR